jgi:cytochrome P450
MDQSRIFRDVASGSFILFRYKDAREILGDNTLWKDPEKAEPAAVLLKSFKPESPGNDYNASMLWLDGAEHSRVRGPFAKSFLKRVSTSRATVEAVIEGHLETLGSRESFDAIADYAAQIPLDVILAFIGANREDLPLVRPWAAALNKVFQPQRTPHDNAEMAAAMASLGTYIDGLIAERRKTPCDDLVSDIAGGDHALTNSEIRVNCIGLITGGILTTTDLIGNAIRLFLLNPPERQKLLANPSLINAAIEEALRLEPPVEGAQRVASRDLAFGGCPVKETQVVVAWIPAANKDAETFESPERFDIERGNVGHLSFGGGAHICLGAPLARLEAQIAILKLLQRFPRLRFSEPDAPPKWRPTPFFHGLEELRVAVN